MSIQDDRARQTEELHEWGVALLRQRLRRERPEADEASIDRLLRQWLMEREGTFSLTPAADWVQPPPV